MASNIPASLRGADIGRFALRAAQIEKAKPVVAYWCQCLPPTPAMELRADRSERDRSFSYCKPNYRERPS